MEINWNLFILGFKALNQAQLLSDVLYFANNDNSQPWLIYYISRPLLGTFDPGGVAQAIVPGGIPQPLQMKAHGDELDRGLNYDRKDITSFGELLAKFPMIERQMKPGLDRLFREFGKELGKPLPPPPSESPSSPSESQSNGDVSSKGSPSLEHSLASTHLYLEDGEDYMKSALETAVTAAIDLFRLVDKQQLSVLGATTSLTGPMVERLIERYVTEQVHDSLLFPRLCRYHQIDDAKLDAHIRQMENIDVSQVGITIEGGQQGKLELVQRLGKGIDEFRKIANGKCPQDMLQTLLATFKIVTTSHDMLQPEETIDMSSSVLTINADILVSLLLLVIIRSQVRHLQARLFYMQEYIFSDDVQNGESGYALSTFEAVLAYLRDESSGLRRASAKNRRLWSATKLGKVSEIKSILEPDARSSSSSEDEYSAVDDEQRSTASDSNTTELSHSAINEPRTNGGISADWLADVQTMSPPSETAVMAHVFQPLAHDYPPPSSKARKRVSLDTRSLSGSSIASYISHSTALESIASCLEGDVSIENLTRTQGSSGDSIPMMAVEASQTGSLKYLLALTQYYSLDRILQDTNTEGTTLLSAAVQLAHTETVDIILDYILQDSTPEDIAAYLSKADTMGRTVAHYLFSAPGLMSRLGSAIPWKQKDKNGQTPLFALSRSYDHQDYASMVNEALTSARQAQGDGRALKLDDHVDVKGNTLLHIISDPNIILRILEECDCDPNATNAKKFTPLMMASKYGRIDLVKTFFSDPRVDIRLREFRGLTAIELAKDEDIRNKIDDLILFTSPPGISPIDHPRRITRVVRSLFIEDAGMRFIIKSGAPSHISRPADSQSRTGTTYTITTCRRSISDFEDLIRLLKMEHPASYIPELPLFRSPLQIPSKPSRAVLHGIQDQLDRLIKLLLGHPTFSTHELLWEFFLVPEIQTDMIEGRSARKTDVLYETMMDDYEPVTEDGIRDINQILSHAKDAVQSVSDATNSVIQRGHILQRSFTDFADSLLLCGHPIESLRPPTNALPLSHIEAFHRFTSCFATLPDSSPLREYIAFLNSLHSTTTAVLTSLSRPDELISTLHRTKLALTRSHTNIASSSLPRTFNFAVLEESRQRSIREQEAKIRVLTAETEEVQKEIAWNKDVVVGELAGWTSWREEVGKRAVRDFVKTTIIREKERARRMERCLRMIRE